MCENCIGCFLRNDEDGKELCFLNPDQPKEINYSDPACEHFELSDSAAAERRKAPGELQSAVAFPLAYQVPFVLPSQIP